MKFFKKKDIKAGYVLTFNDEKYAIVTYNDNDELCYSSDYRWGNINSLDDELVVNNGCSPYRVIAIYGRTANMTAYMNSTIDRECLWRYQEPKKMTMKEIEEALGYPVEIIEGE